MARKIKNLYLALERVARVLLPFPLSLSLSLIYVHRLFALHLLSISVFFIRSRIISLSRSHSNSLPRAKSYVYTTVRSSVSLECIRLDSIKFIAINDN